MRKYGPWSGTPQSVRQIKRDSTATTGCNNDLRAKTKGGSVAVSAAVRRACLSNLGVGSASGLTVGN